MLRNGQLRLPRRIRVPGDLLRRHRTSEQVTLKGVTAQLGQEILLLGGFHTFGHHFQIQRLAEGDNRRDNAGVFASGNQIVDKGAVDFQLAGR